jgi:NAD(P)H-nitrite reductase large subunit
MLTNSRRITIGFDGTNHRQCWPSPTLLRNQNSTMQLDEDICLCFHVSLRKVKKFIRLEQPVRASQISQCYGAGTGCGWCRPFLEQLLAQTQAAEPPAAPVADGANASTDGICRDLAEQSLTSITADQYAQQRKNYVQQNKQPPAAP